MRASYESGRSAWILAAWLVLLVAWVFAPTLHFGFVDWDDNQYVFENLLVTGSRPWSEYWLTPALGYPVPLVVATYRVEAWFGALHAPWIFHATNVALHAVNVVLLLVLALRLGLSRPAAFVAACMLAIHPVVGEPVAWVTGRKDLLVTCFGLAALVVATRPRPRDRWPAVPLVLAALASKPTAISVVVLLVWMHREHLIGPLASRRARSGAAVLLALALGGVVVAFREHAAFGGQTVDGNAFDQARRALYAVGFTCRMVLGLEVPTMKYIVEPIPNSPVLGVDGLTVALGLALALAYRAMPEPHRARASFGVVFAGLAFAPYANLVPLLRFLADSYVYLALAGIGLALGASLDAAFDRLPRRDLYVTALAATFVVVLLPRTTASMQRFSTDVALFGQAHTRYPRSLMLCRRWSLADPDPATVLRATDECIERFGPGTFERSRAIALFELGRTEEAVQWGRMAMHRDRRSHDMPLALLRLLKPL